MNNPNSDQFVAIFIPPSNGGRNTIGGSVGCFVGVLVGAVVGVSVGTAVVASAIGVSLGAIGVVSVTSATGVSVGISVGAAVGVPCPAMRGFTAIGRLDSPDAPAPLNARTTNVCAPNLLATHSCAAMNCTCPCGVSASFVFASCPSTYSSTRVTPFGSADADCTGTTSPSKKLAPYNGLSMRTVGTLAGACGPAPAHAARTIMKAIVIIEMDFILLPSSVVRRRSSVAYFNPSSAFCASWSVQEQFGKMLARKNVSISSLGIILLHVLNACIAFWKLARASAWSF